MGRQEEARDLAQDVFVRAWRGLRGFKEQSAFSTWLYRIGVNVCLNRAAAKAAAPRRDGSARRHGQRRPSCRRSGRGHRSQPSGGARETGHREAGAEAARDAHLRVYHELPHERIAEILGSSVGASKANFFHALANLKKLLEDDPCI